MGAFGSDSKSETRVKKSTKTITANDNAVVQTHNLRRGSIVSGDLIKDSGNIKLAKGSTFTQNVSQGLSAEQLSGIVGDFGTNIRNVLAQAATSNSSATDPVEERLADQITNAPAATAAEARSYKWLVVALLVVALIAGGVMKFKGRKKA